MGPGADVANQHPINHDFNIDAFNDDRNSEELGPSPRGVMELDLGFFGVGWSNTLTFVGRETKKNGQIGNANLKN